MYVKEEGALLTISTCFGGANIFSEVRLKTVKGQSSLLAFPKISMA